MKGEHKETQITDKRPGFDPPAPNARPTIKKVKNLKIGSLFDFEGDTFTVTSFPSRATMVGDNVNPGPGRPGHICVSIKDTTIPILNSDPVFRCKNPILEWGDLSDEQFRVYVWPDGATIKLTAPLKLNVSKSSGHRVFTADGVSHYIPGGWIHIYWVVKPGEDHFKF